MHRVSADGLAALAHIYMNSLYLQISSLLPSNRFRSALVHQLVAAFARERPGWIRIIRPVPATAKELLVYHDAEYVGPIHLFSSVGISTDHVIFQTSFWETSRRQTVLESKVTSKIVEAFPLN